MKQLSLIGLGMSADTLTAEGSRALSQAEVIFGAPRMLGALPKSEKTLVPLYKPAEVAAAIEASAAERFAVLLSGDVGFYSGAAQLFSALAAYSPRLIPGVSSLSAFCARLGLPWQDVYTVSAHGARCDLVGAVRRHRRCFCLTGGNTRELGAALCEAGFGELTVRVGEALGAPGERVFSLRVHELREAALAPLCVLLIENERWDARVRFGIADSEFTREAAFPMTKSEVRALALSRLAPRPTDTAWDIGCGTGSVTVELALACYEGRVCAVDKEPAALALTQKNCRRFSVGNVELGEGTAPEICAGLPAPDVVFLGGSSGRMGEILAAVHERNENARVVVTAIALESAAAALSAMKTLWGREPELTELFAARAKSAGSLHLLTGQNPIFILSAGGERDA